MCVCVCVCVRVRACVFCSNNLMMAVVDKLQAMVDGVV